MLEDGRPNRFEFLKLRNADQIVVGINGRGLRCRRKPRLKQLGHAIDPRPQFRQLAVAASRGFGLRTLKLPAAQPERLADHIAEHLEAKRLLDHALSVAVSGPDDFQSFGKGANRPAIGLKQSAPLLAIRLGTQPIKQVVDAARRMLQRIKIAIAHVAVTVAAPAIAVAVQRVQRGDDKPARITAFGRTVRRNARQRLRDRAAVTTKLHR